MGQLNMIDAVAFLRNYCYTITKGEHIYEY